MSFSTTSLSNMSRRICCTDISSLRSSSYSTPARKQKPRETCEQYHYSWRQMQSSVVFIYEKGLFFILQERTLLISSFTTTGEYLRIVRYIPHKNEQYFSRTLIGQLRGDQPSTIHLTEHLKKHKMAFAGIVSQIKLLFGLLHVVIQLACYLSIIISAPNGACSLYKPQKLVVCCLNSCLLSIQSCGTLEMYICTVCTGRTASH